MDNSRNNRVRGGGGRGGYSNQGGGRGGGRGNYQNTGGGGGGRGDYPNQPNQAGGGRSGNHQNRSNQGGDGGRGFHNQSAQGGNGLGSYQNQPNVGDRGGGRGSNTNPSNQGGGGRGWGGANRGPHDQPTGQWANMPQAQPAWGNRLPHTPPSEPPQQMTVHGPSTSQPQPPDDELSSKISELHLSAPTATATATASASKSGEKQIQPIKRPDKGGKLAIRSIRLLVNHFPVNFDHHKTIIHYDVDVKPESSGDKRIVKKPIRRSDLRLIRDKLFSDDARFTALKSAYDGEKNIFSAVPLPTGKFRVDIGADEEVKGGSYTFTIKLVNELKLSKLKDYLGGNLSSVPRDILQGMDLVMKENPSRQRISVGRYFYSPDYRKGDDLNCGVAAYRGFQSSLKPTSQGLVMCLDYSTLAFHKPLPIIDFLIEHIPLFQGANDVKRFKREVNSALKGLKIRVVHRKTKQKYTIVGLAQEDTRDCYFDLNDPEGINPPQRTNLVTYFKDKWEKNIMYPNIPCLELGRNNRSNKVPMEFCVLVEGQRFAKENLDRDRALFLKNLTLVKPCVRKDTINEMVRAPDGPCGDVTRSFTIGVDVNMTKVLGRVIGAPELKIGDPRPIRVDAEKCQWNLVGGKKLLDGKNLERWALLDFTDGDRYNKLRVGEFVDNLRGRSRNLGIHMEEPLVYRATRMNELLFANKLENLFRNVVEESNRITKGMKLQMIICVMTRKDPGYKTLKLVSETRIGVVTQCCLSPAANKGQDQYLANLCLKINAKLGGSNFELTGKLPHFLPQDHVMFIGADVNHPAPMNASCPSIAAVVATVNWPAANRYAARVSPQAHRTEKIVKFGSICLDLVKTYARLNKVRPNKIVVFRDGVSEGQFDMVLAEELLDLKQAICDGQYNPAITIVVAQKRHQTRLFVEHRNDGGATGNVPPGTVVDTKIVHPFDFDFYLASHYGGIGTSKPTHYYVLWDENFFTSDEMQKMIYDMCFTFARCTKPVSLVPPVYYADLVAYRGRMFQEALMETQGPARPSSSYAPVSSADSTSFDASLYNLHSDLENVMFFV